MTNLLRIGGAKGELLGGKHVLTSVVDGTRLKGIRSEFALQFVDQLHIEPKGEGFFGGEDNYQISRVLST